METGMDCCLRKCGWNVVHVSEFRRNIPYVQVTIGDLSHYADSSAHNVLQVTISEVNKYRPSMDETPRLGLNKYAGRVK
jgi:hypothetical protein